MSPSQRKNVKKRYFSSVPIVLFNYTAFSKKEKLLLLALNSKIFNFSFFFRGR